MRALSGRLQETELALGRTGQIWRGGLEAYLALAEGDRAGASKKVTETVDLISMGRPIHIHCLNSYVRLAEAASGLFLTAVTSDERRRLRDVAKRACTIVAKAARVFPIARPGAKLHRGTLLAAEGRNEEAKRLWLSALQEARLMSLFYLEGRIHEALGLLDDGGDAARHGAIARGIFGRLRLASPQDLRFRVSSGSVDGLQTIPPARTVQAGPEALA